jgi:peptidoglycan/xylan/chitin deacetylase (PgdA/CDA1 family)
MSGGGWPGGARGALCLSFDNLGEAAEIELGAVPADAPLGGHVTATRVVPSMLAALAERGLSATFFVEGLNAEVYPDLLREIDAAGHEVGYHAWRHERWSDLSSTEQADNLARGIAAFEALGLRLDGMRPPGGGLGEDGIGVLRAAGLGYASPAGQGAGLADAEDGGPCIALLPFQWRHVDASCLLPPLGPVREEMTGSPAPLDPDRFLAYLKAELTRLVEEGGFATTVLHPVTIDAWLGEERLAAFLDDVAEAERSGGLRVAPCRDVARDVLANAERFEGGTTLDSASWA